MRSRFKDNPVQMSMAWFFVILLVIIVLTPFFTAIVSSFKGTIDFYEKSYTWFPQKWLFENFIVTWNHVTFGTFMINSIVVALLVTILSTVVSSAAAFSFARINFFGRDVIFYIIILCQAIPFSILFIPSYILMNRLGLLDSYAGLILPSISFPIGTFMMRQTMKAIPMDYEYAAMMDGCNRGQMYLKVFLPMTTNTIIALGIFTFMGSWNNYLWPLLIIKTRELYTMPIALPLFFLGSDSIQRLEWSNLLCAAIMSVLPIFIFYAFASRRFMDGITLSGIKA
jgi:multiple sugar transport system permease protein